MTEETPIFQLRKDRKYWEKRFDENEQEHYQIAAALRNIDHAIKQQQSWDSKAHD